MVYEGNGNYIFISYSHKDSQRVIPIIEALNESGFNVWYDAGIEAGTEWPEYIEEHLKKASVVLAFMSPNAIESRNCRNEINFALELDKDILVVYLEDTPLLKGMRLQLNSTQSLFKKNHTTNEMFIRELLNARILQNCGGDSKEKERISQLGITLNNESTREEKVNNPTRSTVPMQTITYESGATYTGETLNGLRHGKGKYVWPDGEFYEGDWANGARHGHGKYSYANGNVYNGDFTENSITGTGRMEYHDGRVYDGDWVHGFKHGKGKLTCPDGTVYDGDWEEDEMTGKTHFVNSSGVIYDGEVLKGRMHGKGRLTYPDGRVFDGEWENDKFIG